MEYIDNGFWKISQKDAKILAGGYLPAHGHEKLVQYDGKHWWLARTITWGKQVWSIRETSWRLVNGQAVLGGNYD